ncbi:MAG: TIGR04283 family arsenosugar biosynthesis glycosyltransferase [Hyphomicrobiaceae bacterium]
MISVVIPTLNAEDRLAETLSALVTATVEGVVREVIIVDGGSQDRTLEIADQSGAKTIRSARGRGRQLKAGGDEARFEWLLFLHADTVLEAGWEREVVAFIEKVMTGERPDAAAAFRFVLDDTGVRPRLIETGVNARCSVFRLPYGDQGLLISRRLYREIGGFSDLPLMEDVDVVRRLGRRRVAMLRSAAVTSAVRYRRNGYTKRTVRNLACLALYFMRVPVSTIVRLYG